jgi:hypothetical integral membrane protein (TIGR02206 family)
VERYFAWDYHGTPFRMFGAPHLAVLGVILCVCLLMVLFRNRFSEADRRLFRYGAVGVLILNETAFHLWNLGNGAWTIQTMLPLHLCSVMVFAGAAMMATGSYALYEFVYFLGIGGALQALFTPNIGIYGFPHFRFFQTFIAHGFIIFSAVYMTAVEGYRPYLKSLFKVGIGGNIYMIAVTLINLRIGSNYLYTAHKPATSTLLDVLGPWPWYILSMEALGLVVCALLYAPFFIMDMRKGGSIISERT